MRKGFFLLCLPLASCTVSPGTEVSKTERFTIEKGEVLSLEKRSFREIYKACPQALTSMDLELTSKIKDEREAYVEGVGKDNQPVLVSLFKLSEDQTEVRVRFGRGEDTQSAGKLIHQIRKYL